MDKKQIITFENKKEIFYNVVNSLLAGGLVLLGSLADGDFSIKGFCLAFLAGGIVMITKFKNYWELEKPEYSKRLLNFVAY